MPSKKVYCPRCGGLVYFSFDITYPPEQGKQEPRKFQRNGYWYFDTDLTCGHCRSDFWLSGAQFS